MRRRNTSAKPMRIFWWAGVAVLAATTALWYFEVIGSSLAVALSGLGLALCFVSLIIEVRRKGMTAETAEMLAHCIALSFGVFGFFLAHSGTALLIAVAGFFLFIFVGFGAQAWGQWGETKDLWRRYKRWRDGTD